MTRDVTVELRSAVPGNEITMWPEQRVRWIRKTRPRRLDRGTRPRPLSGTLHVAIRISGATVSTGGRVSRSRGWAYPCVLEHQNRIFAASAATRERCCLSILRPDALPV